MFRKNMNFKPVIFKVFFTYLVVYVLALIFKYTYDIEILISNIHYKYLITLNMISIFFGLPFSIIFDFVLIKLFGLYYILFFSPALTIISVFQVLILRKMKFKFSKNIFFLERKKINNLYKFFENMTFKSSFILIIRSFPIMPHVLGSYFIASSKIKKKIILFNTFLGSFFYYIFLYLLIGNV